MPFSFAASLAVLMLSRAPAASRSGIHDIAAACSQKVTGLDAPVRIDIQGGTIAQFASDLSRQSALVIEPADYIKERKITVSLKAVTAKQALDTACDLCGWTWTRKGENTISIERPRPGLPRSIHEIGGCLRGALPRDVQRFLGLNVRPADRVKPTDPAWARAFDDPAQAHRFAMQQRVDALTRELQIELFEALKPELLGGTAKSVATITGEQRRLLVRVLCLQALRGLDFGLIDGAVKPYEEEPANCLLDLKDGIELRIFRVSRTGNRETISGFGARLEEPQPIKPP